MTCPTDRPNCRAESARRGHSLRRVPDAAFDVFDSGSALEQVVGFLIHLAPVYAVVLALIFAWRWPRGWWVLFLALPWASRLPSAGARWVWVFWC
ncbi:MAG: hypothetical protein KIT52_06660 [Anaerolineae bacterium]|nr:hypothetical protein [Anaerolineae bacterium]